MLIKLKTLFGIVIFCLFVLPAIGQCNYSNSTFIAGEKASYEVYYNWGFIWLNAGKVIFQVKAETYQNKPAYRLKSTGRTYDNYDWIYKVRDRFESLIDTVAITPYSFSRKTNEGNYSVNNTYSFNYTTKTILSNTWNNETLQKIDTLQNTDCTLDVLSAIYACRTIDFKNKTINDTIPLNMVVDGEIFNINVRFLGEETIINRDKRLFSCNKFSVMLVEGTIFEGGEEMFVWVSNDKNQIPILIEAKILVGSVKAMLKDVIGYKWPANYQVFSADTLKK